MRTMMHMMVEYAETPLAIGTRIPRFSWELPLAGRNRRQSAYQVLVATVPERLTPGQADMWDSGKVESSQSVNVPYAGAELHSNADYVWTVRLMHLPSGTAVTQEARCGGIGCWGG
jgi:alpha-L-rhamnosidase